MPIETASMSFRAVAASTFYPVEASMQALVPVGPQTQAWHLISQGAWWVARKSSGLWMYDGELNWCTCTHLSSVGFLPWAWDFCGYTMTVHSTLFKKQLQALSVIFMVLKTQRLSLYFYTYLWLHVPCLQALTIHHSRWESQCLPTNSTNNLQLLNDHAFYLIL